MPDLGPIEITRLRPTQAGLRNPSRVRGLADVLRGNPAYRIGPNPVQISDFGDGQLYVHNGHHRVSACVLAGRTALLPGEYEVRSWTFEKYAEINWSCNWTTPFYPPTEVRVADLSVFRRAVALVDQMAGRAAAEVFIRRYGAFYKRPRTTDLFVELVAVALARVGGADGESH